MSKKKNYYDKAFKERAVGLLLQGRKVKELSEELNVPKAYLYRWRRESKTYDASVRFQGNGKERLTPEQERIRELERELADAKLQHEILNRACELTPVKKQLASSPRATGTLRMDRSASRCISC